MYRVRIDLHLQLFVSKLFFSECGYGKQPSTCHLYQIITLYPKQLHACEWYHYKAYEIHFLTMCISQKVILQLIPEFDGTGHIFCVNVLVLISANLTLECIQVKCHR